MTRCLLLTCDGAHREVDVEHARVAEHLGGPVTFVGALHAIDAVVVGLQASALLPRHPLTHRRDVFFSDEVRGPLLVVASDERGRERDLDVEACLDLLL